MQHDIDLVVQCGPCELCFVPSRHGSHQFSTIVRTVVPTCDGIAVELAVDIADAAAKLVRKHASQPSDRIPGPLGLVIAKGVSQVECVPIVENDSICEGIRLATEHSLPLYGIDRPTPTAGTKDDDICPAEETENRLLPDTVNIQSFAAYRAYVKCHWTADPFPAARGEAFDMRNVHMAMSLRQIAANHRRVVVVIGMAHFLAIRELLLLNKPLVLDMPVNQPERTISPVVLSPEVALPWLGLAPVIAESYAQQRSRTNPGEPVDIRPKEIIANCIHKAIERAANPGTRKIVGSQPTARELLGFHRILEAYQTLRNQAVPNFDTLVTVAKTAAGDAFAATLAECLMEYRWQNGESLPYPMLARTPDQPDARDGIYVHIGNSTKRMWLQQDDPISMPRGTEYASGSSSKGSRGLTRTWPKDDLHSVIVAKRVAELLDSERETEEQECLPFTEIYSILDGLDARATVRSLIRGERKLYVRDRVPASRRRRPASPYPIMYLFHERGDGHWASWHAPIPNATSHQRYYHGAVGFGHRMRVSTTVSEQHWGGCIHFGPLTWDSKEWLQWLEEHQDEIPIGGSILESFFPKLRWRKAPLAEHLLRIGLHHAPEALTVVSQRSRGRRSFEEIAAREGKQLNWVHADLLPRRHLERVRRGRLVSWDYDCDETWSGGLPVDGVEATLGEAAYE